MTQECFVKIYRSLSSFRGDSRFSAWVYRIASNVCLDFLRSKSKRQTVSLTRDGEDDDGEDDDEKPRRAGRRSRTVSDDKYDVSGIETLSFEFPDTATPLVSDDKADEGDFWESFKFELRNGDTDEPPKPQPAAEPKPAAPKAKAKSSEYDLESILAEFKDL